MDQWEIGFQTSTDGGTQSVSVKHHLCAVGRHLAIRDFEWKRKQSLGWGQCFTGDTAQPNPKKNMGLVVKGTKTFLIRWVALAPGTLPLSLSLCLCVCVCVFVWEFWGTAVQPLHSHWVRCNCRDSQPHVDLSHAVSYVTCSSGSEHVCTLCCVHHHVTEHQPKLPKTLRLTTVFNIQGWVLLPTPTV